ncbi:rve-domain-containing protein, partial [Exidia glandulosa HHB12029]
TDGGSHFDCAEVRDFCAANGIEYTKTPPYSPWANGLVEDCNKILLARLRRYCQPDFDADETGMSAKDMAAHTPTKWPDFFAQALEDMNSRILPSLGYSPRELLFGMTLTDAHTPPQGTEPAASDTANVHLALAD